MAGLSISDLPLPSGEFRPDLANYARGRFETDNAARLEDAQRVELLHRAASMAVRPSNRAAAIELAHKLSSEHSNPPMTLASSRYMREARIRVAGALWELAEELQPAIFTLIPRGLEVPGGALDRVDPRRLREALRSDLYRAGVTTQGGYLAAFLDGEYEIASDTFRLHFHGVVAGDITQTLRRLGQESRKHSSTRARQSSVPSTQRLRVQTALTNLPAPFTYLLKPYWAARWEGRIDGRFVRQRRRSRIPEPRHSQLLLWLDRWRLPDLTLLLKLRATKDGLRRTASSYAN